jgi:hypothetical protein
MMAVASDVTFTQAIKFGFRNYFSGRASRSEF